MESRWEDVLAWLEENVPQPTAPASAQLLPMRLRALGETGDVEQLGVARIYANPTVHASPVLRRSLASSSAASMKKVRLGVLSGSSR